MGGYLWTMVAAIWDVMDGTSRRALRAVGSSVPEPTGWEAYSTTNLCKAKRAFSVVFSSTCPSRMDRYCTRASPMLRVRCLEGFPSRWNMWQMPSKSCGWVSFSLWMAVLYFVDAVVSLSM